MAVKVQFEIGHTSKLRTKKTPEGFTHDWELYVKGIDRADISLYVEKVVFNLHASFSKPKRAFKDPPYIIQESGYAGFMLPIDIYFRNRDEPKRVQFAYDLDLQQTGPPHHRYEHKKFIFENPSEEFRQKLIKGGGVPVAGVVGGAIHPPVKPPGTQAIMSSVSLSDANSRGTIGSTESMRPSKHKGSSNESKKHKSRYSDESKNNTFANLFGTPIHKNPSEPKSDPILSNEKLNKEKDNMGKIVEKLDKKEKQKIHKNVQNKSKPVMSSNEKTEKKNLVEKPKTHKLSDKDRIREREKEENTSSNRNSTQKHVDITKKSEISSSGRVDEYRKDKVENSDKTKLMLQSSSKKIKKEKKDKDRRKESNVKKYHNIVQENSIDSQTMKELFTNVERSSKDSLNSPSSKSSLNPSKEIRENEISEKKTYDTSKEKRYSEKDTETSSNRSSLKLKDKETKSSHKYKKKNKNKEHDRKDDKKKKSAENVKESKEIDLLKSNIVFNNQSSSSNTVLTSTIPTPMGGTLTQSVENKPRAKENTQQRKETSSSKSKFSHKSECTEEKQTKTSSQNLQNLVNNVNIDLNDSVEIVQTTQNLSRGKGYSLSTTAGVQLHEDSSNSSFPDLPVKSNEINKSPKKPTDETNKSTSSRNQQKQNIEKISKKEKRNRLNHTNAPSKSSFVEPPTKQIKREQISKSPENSSRSSTALPHDLLQSTSSPSQVMQYVNTVNNMAMYLNSEYFVELQELQNKIMTLEDMELQQVVEIIASTGCFEITTKTFDFDLCKLDRNIVQRLQNLLSSNTIF